MGLIKPGSKIKTLFFSGTVVSVIDGKSKGWRSTEYYEVRVTKPRLHKSKCLQIVRLDEIKGVS